MGATPPRRAPVPTIEVPVGIGAKHRVSAAQVAVAHAIGKPAVATLIAGGAQGPHEARHNGRVLRLTQPAAKKRASSYVQPA